MSTTTALVIDTHAVRRDGEMWCLTDLWRAAGAPKLRPAKWLETDTAQMFVDFIRDSVGVAVGDILRNVRGNPRSGDGGSTWAHWQIALAYAKALSPAFHARVNEVYRAFAAGLLVARAPSSVERELVDLSLRFKALEEGRKSVWSTELNLELARLRRIDWAGNGAEPQPLAIAYGRTWRIILGDVVYEELKRRNPNPREGSLHSQWLQDRRYELAKDSDMAITLVIARRCTRWTEFENELRAAFRRAPIQLHLVAGNKRRR